MLQFLPYEPDHLRQLELQDHQAFMRPLIEEGPEYPEAIQRPDLVMTARDGERIVAVAGILPLWEGRALGWAFFSPSIGGQHFLQITRRTIRFLDDAQAKGHRRVETSVACKFLPGVRWVRALGFKLEGRMERYCPDGRDHFLYARVR